MPDRLPLLDTHTVVHNLAMPSDQLVQTAIAIMGPIYSSPEEAEADAVKIFRDAMGSGAISGKAK